VEGSAGVKGRRHLARQRVRDLARSGPPESIPNCLSAATVWVNQGETPGTPLTADEEQVLRLLIEGHTRQETSATLGLSPEIVRAHVQVILVKLQVQSGSPPPDPPLAASAALAVPFQRAEDVPRHIGRWVPRKVCDPQRV
jgi:DNA-binding NarL/FixJ family response regulator